MTRKDYELIASVLKRARTNAHAEGRSMDTLLQVTRMFCDALAADNPRFDAHRFQIACMADRKE